MLRIGITTGDPAGVGPELIVRIADAFREDTAYVIYGEEKTLAEACRLVGKPLKFRRIDAPSCADAPGLYLIDMDISNVAIPEPSLTSGKVAVAYLARATVDAVRGDLKGLLTMPLSKFWARRAGLSCEGQTEYLAQASGVKRFAMMMFSEKLRLVLLSTHVPLSEVPPLVRKDRIREKLALILDEYPKLFGKEPSVGVLGLNPHSGEWGETGKEDVEEILPAVEEFREKGYPVEGPLAPDTAFLQRERYEVFLCMYHDQGLIPFKLLSFREGVNLTLGLPFPRTSPDHGTAYDIAWQGRADPTSALKALELLHRLIENLNR